MEFLFFAPFHVYDEENNQEGCMIGRYQHIALVVVLTTIPRSSMYEIHISISAMLALLTRLDDFAILSSRPNINPITKCAQ